MGVMLLQVALGLCFAFAASAKLLRTADVSDALAGSGMQPHTAARLARLVAGVELLLAVALLAAQGQARVYAFAAAAITLAGFTIWTADVLRRGLTVACACFGRKGRVTTASLFRNVALLAGALVGCFVAAGETTSNPEQVLSQSIVATAVVALVVLARGFVAALPVLSLSRPRLEEEQPHV